ncbi:hypothetical protein lerEdw1_010762 [Lerista edwardsae]|nr:hypothetical protein lerEdw1_010762 [Lerista edwardsae]
MDLLQHHSRKEDHHEDPAVPGSNSVHHCHSHSKAHEHSQEEQHQAKSKLCVAAVICLIFMIAEVIGERSDCCGSFDPGGRIAGSLAVIMDAAHVLVDLMSFLISLLSLWLSSKSPSKRLTYGWHRAGRPLTMQHNPAK